MIYAHYVPQVAETAVILSQHLYTPVTWDSRLQGLHLGVLHGLNQLEASQFFPKDWYRLEMWRQGKLPIYKLNIQNAEPLHHFRQRVESVYQEWISQVHINTIIAVLTRSTLIMLTNLIKLGKNFNYRDYQVYDFAPASITLVELDPSPRLLLFNSTAHLQPCLSFETS